MADRLDRPLTLPLIGAEPKRRQDRETEAQRERRLARLAVQLAERERRARQDIAALTGSLPRNRHGSVTRLDAIDDPERRMAVLKARVERLEAVLNKLNRKRDTRAKIVLGAALYAEARDLGDETLLERFREILDRRVERPTDRLAILEAFGIDLKPLRGEAGLSDRPPLPDFDALIPESARSAHVRGSKVHPDYAGMRKRHVAPLKGAAPGSEHPRPADHPKE